MHTCETVIASFLVFTIPLINRNGIVIMLLTSIGQHYAVPYKKLNIERTIIGLNLNVQNIKADREYICKLQTQKIRTIRQRTRTKYKIRNAIFRINNKNRSIILNGSKFMCSLFYSALHVTMKTMQTTNRS